MADSFSPSLTLCSNGSMYRFRSTRHLCSFLGISSPYDDCIAYAPRARNAPHCSRKVHRDNLSKVPDLLAQLVDIRIPSSRAGLLLNKLSSCVVCGITGWHQKDADKIYQEWCDKLKNEYLRANRPEPIIFRPVPSRLTMATGENNPEVSGAGQQYEEDISDDSTTDSDVPSEDEHEDDSVSSGSVVTPDSTISDIMEGFSGRDTRSDSNENTERSRRPPEPPANTRRPSRATFTVYRDPERYPAVQSDTEQSQTLSTPESRDFTQLSTSSTAGNSGALRPLDRNVLTSPANRNVSASADRERSQACSNSSGAPDRRCGNRNGGPRDATDRLEAEDSSNRALVPQVPVHRRCEEVSYSKKDNQRNQSPSNVTQLPASVGVVGRRETPDESEEYVEPSHANSHSLGQDQSYREVPQDVNWPFQQSNDEAISTAAEAQYDEDQHDQSSSNGEDHFPPDLLALLDILDNSSPEPNIPIPRGTFRLYRQLPPPRRLKGLLNCIPQTVKPLLRCAGFIYAYARPSLPGFLKIGYTKDTTMSRHSYLDPVNNRLKNWEEKCGHPVEEVFRVYVPCAVERIENLVHQTLQEYRRVEHCERCKRRNRKIGRGGGTHDEWFEVDEETARRVVDLWRQFSEQRPYDGFGRLVDFWSQRVENDRERVGDGNSVRGWVERMPQMVEELRRQEFRNLLNIRF